jgi:hypothetical protein
MPVVLFVRNKRIIYNNRDESRAIVAGLSTVEVMVFSENRVLAEQLPDELVRLSRGLKLGHQRYFHMGRGEIVVPLKTVVLTKFEPQAAFNAVRRMQQSVAETRSRREPISVREFRIDRYLVTDGNATTMVAAAAGWDTLPVLSK